MLFNNYLLVAQNSRTASPSMRHAHCATIVASRIYQWARRIIMKNSENLNVVNKTKETNEI